MTTISHEPSKVDSDRRRWSDFIIPEMWASVAIGIIWLSVLFDSVYGPNIYTSSAGGTDSAVIPSAVVVSFFAFLATWVIARHAFRHEHSD
jgi:hypothetical protein